MSQIHKNTFKVHHGAGRVDRGFAVSARRNEGAYVKQQPQLNTPMVLNGTEFADKDTALAFASKKLPVYCQVRRNGFVSDIVRCDTLPRLAVALQVSPPTLIIVRKISHR